MNKYRIILNNEVKYIDASSCNVVDGCLNFYGENYNLISSFSPGSWDSFEQVAASPLHNVVIMGDNVIVGKDM